MTEYIVITGDQQCPLEDRKVVDVVAGFLADRNLTSINAGDEADFTSLGRWVRGLKGEYAGDLDQARTRTREVLTDLRVTDIVRSNHIDRLETYLERHAPALAELPELKYERFMGLDDLNVTFHRKPFQFLPGWLLMHGDEGGISQQPGQTALKLSQRTNMNVVCGHVHRGAALPWTFGATGVKRTRRWAMEVGCMMDFAKADYIKAGMMQWQHGFGIIVKDGKDVIPHFVPIDNGKFYFDEKWYRA